MSSVHGPRGLVFDIRRNSFHDGPGLRTTVFLKGCPLSCAWCHNPEGISPEPELLLRPQRCLGCGACEKACPLGLKPRDIAAGGPDHGGAASPSLAVRHGPSLKTARPSSPCADCPAPCAEACPAEALQLVGRSMDIAELMAELRADKVFYDSSGGGITFSGGEPLAQPGFLSAALDACRAEGIRTAIETSSFAKPAAFMGIALKTDLLLLDLKAMDAARHRDYTGRTNGLILANIRSAAKAGLSYALRVPLVPGYTDSDAGLMAMADFAAELELCWMAARERIAESEAAPDSSASAQAGGDKADRPRESGDARPQIHILPYHDAAKAKYVVRKLPYRMGDTAVPDRKRLEEAAGIFSRRGLRVCIGG